MLERGDLGELLYIDCVRVNLGLFQPDVNVVWDLAAHDASIVMHLLRREPLWISAIGSAHYGPFESQAYVTLKYDEALLVHLHVNWLAPVKIRSTLIGGSKRMIVYDDLSPGEQVRVYEKGVTLNGNAADRSHALVDYRVGDMLAPHITKVEPLERVCREFLAAIEERRAPLTDGLAGLAVVRILEAAQESIRKEGERIHLAGSPKRTP
jgi:predicted dehydrogenase